MTVAPGRKIYFISDFHLGAPDADSSLVREKKIVRFLENCKQDAQEIFVLGDMFDFWFEYKNVVPKGHVRLLGKLAELADMGIPLHFFVGNHDMWMKDYFQKELKMNVYHEPRAFEYTGKRFLIGHGDGLGPGDHGYKTLKKIFRNPVSKFMFGLLHPSVGISIANYFSRKSREKTGSADEEFLGENGEWLIIYAREVLAREHFDYFIFGHRHYPIDYKLNNNSRYINLGDWVRTFTYAEFDGNLLQLKKWEDSPV